MTTKFCGHLPALALAGLLVTGVMVVVMAARPSSDNIPSLTSQIGLVCRDQLPSHQPAVAAHFLLLIFAKTKMYELFPSLVFALILAKVDSFD